MPLKKIVVIGPESTGKSWLCESLANHYNTLWCPEYARTYLDKHGADYQRDDLTRIAMGQLALEDQLADQAITEGGRYLFIDTDMYVMKVWSEFSFNSCAHYILDQIAQRSYDLYVLCHTDLPWSPDKLREYPDPSTRSALFNMYKDILVHQQIPFVEVKGTGSQRLLPVQQYMDAQMK